MGMLSHARKKKARKLGLADNNLGIANKGRGRQKLRKQRQEADMEAAAQAIEKKYTTLRGGEGLVKKKFVRQHSNKKKATPPPQKGLVESVVHEVQVCAENKKASVLMGFLLRLFENVKKSRTQVLISVSNKDDLVRLAQFLATESVQTALSNPTLSSLHDEVPDSERKTIVADFWMGRTIILIVVDKVFESVRTPSHLINFDFPPSLADYIQRANRVGRSGRSGSVVTLFTDKNAPVATPLIRFLRSNDQPVSRELLDLTIGYLEDKLATPESPAPSTNKVRKRARVETASFD
jgi:superfamily II DNA/RNA helicase